MNHVFGRIFEPAHKIREGDETMDQKGRILAAFIDSFVRDMAEVYVPVVRLGFGVRPEFLAELDEFMEGPEDIDPMTLPPELREAIKMKNALLGRMAECARLLERAPQKARDLLRPYTGTVEELLTLAVLTEFRGRGFILPGIYEPR